MCVLCEWCMCGVCVLCEWFRGCVCVGCEEVLCVWCLCGVLCVCVCVCVCVWSGLVCVVLVWSVRWKRQCAAQLVLCVCGRV